MRKICSFCESDISERDEDDYCCDGAYIKALRDVLEEL